MKKIALIIAMLLATASTFAQEEITKFLGIPVDGTKAEMKQKLIAKGFTYDSQYDLFEGEFNDRDVFVSIGTSNNKVWRIVVQDAVTSSETNIRIRFNNLCSQFENNKKYIPSHMGMEDYKIPSDEDISYEMLVNNKRYEASYFQLASQIDTVAMAMKVREKLLEKFTEEQIQEYGDEVQYNSYAWTAYFMAQEAKNRSVWFMINEKYGEYKVVLYYDNECNRSNGDDL